MIIGTKSLKSVDQTGKKMIQIIKKYSQDLGALSHIPLLDFFNYVCTLPYYKDPLHVEFLQRPKHSLNSTPFRDCDDKTILMASWCYQNRFPCKLVAVGIKRLSHVYPEIYFNGDWFPIDATYPENKPFETRHYPKKKVLGIV